MENLKSYLDGELDLAQQTEVETHLRNDGELQKMVEDFKSISATLQTVDSGEPFGFEKLEERLAKSAVKDRSEVQKIWKIATWWSVGAAVVALAVLTVGFPMFAQSKASGDVTTSTFGEVTKSLYARKADSSAASSAAQIDKMVTAKAPSGGGTASDAPPIGGGRDATKSPSDGDKSVDLGMSQESAKAAVPDAEFSNGASTKSNTESDFKASMRTIRDQQQRSPVSLNDTPHGIYLERSGQIQVKVDDLMRSVDEATGMVQGLDGFVANHELQNQENGGVATMTLRVPTKNYNAAMNKLQAMGEVISVNSASQDITTETVDNSTRMISWADEEKRLVDALAKAKTNDEKWRIRNQLANVRANLEAYRATVKSLKERSEYSTINVTFLRGDNADKAIGNGPSSNWSGNALRDAKGQLGSVGQVLGTLAIYGLVFTPVWLPFLIAFLVIRKRNQ